MWSIDTLWFEVAIVSIVIALGNIFFGHFEERSPRFRKFLKYIVLLTVTLSLSYFTSRTFAMWFLGAWLIPLVYIHGYLLPKKGINGWTAEPKDKYYEFRGWDKDIFGRKKEN